MYKVHVAILIPVLFVQSVVLSDVLFHSDIVRFSFSLLFFSTGTHIIYISTQQHSLPPRLYLLPAKKLAMEFLATFFFPPPCRPTTEATAFAAAAKLRFEPRFTFDATCVALVGLLLLR